ncbi:helix-turn-helix domain-containing protein [Staphylococcus caeli]|uniref:helix-turn-helix domain-containing protein n=1 Tax=Staphylococcus caeli TaxID=2201815 RepID=UPI003F562115
MKLNLDRLQRVRKRKNYTQEEIAKALGFKSRSAYSKRENGLATIGADELALISELLGYDMEYFFD